jgi:hypothetical protein
MRKTTLFALMIACGSAALGCGDDGEARGECPADLHLEVGAAICDFTAGEVECFYTTVVDEGTELDVVSCGGENDTCGFELLIALYEGEPVDGEIGMFDESADYETEGDLVPDVWDLEKTDSRMTLDFAGALADDASILVEACVDDLPWTEGMLGEDDEDDDGDSDMSCDAVGGDIEGGVCSLFWWDCSDGDDYEIECAVDDAGEGMCTCDVNGETVQECETTDGCYGDVVCCTEFPDLPE